MWGVNEVMARIFKITKESKYHNFKKGQIVVLVSDFRDGYMEMMTQEAYDKAFWEGKVQDVLASDMEEITHD